MTLPHAAGAAPLMPLPELTLPALRQAVAVLVPSRLPEFFNDMQAAFVRAGDEDSVDTRREETMVSHDELADIEHRYREAKDRLQDLGFVITG